MIARSAQDFTINPDILPETNGPEASLQSMAETFLLFVCGVAACQFLRLREALGKANGPV